MKKRVPLFKDIISHSLLLPLSPYNRIKLCFTTKKLWYKLKIYSYYTRRVLLTSVINMTDSICLFWRFEQHNKVFFYDWIQNAACHNYPNLCEWILHFSGDSSYYRNLLIVSAATGGHISLCMTHINNVIENKSRLCLVRERFSYISSSLDEACKGGHLDLVKILHAKLKLVHIDFRMSRYTREIALSNQFYDIEKFFIEENQKKIKN